MVRGETMYSITFQQIEAFLSVAKHLNMTRAAEELFVSQPTLSKTLQRFEAGVGYKVFERNNKGMQLTTQGEMLHNRLEAIYHAMEIAIDDASNAVDDNKKTLTILVPSTFDVSEDYNGVKEALKLFKDNNPNVKVVENLFSFDEMKQQIDLGMFDLVITYSFVLDPYKELERRVLNPYSMYISVASTNPIAKCETLPVEELSKMNAIVEISKTSRTKEQMDIIEGNFRTLGIIPKSIEPVDNTITLMHKLINDEGFSLCGKLGSARIKHFNLEPNAGKKIRLDLEIACKKDGCSAEAKELLRYFE